MYKTLSSQEINYMELEEIENFLLPFPGGEQGCDSKMDGCSMSMSSVGGKVVYESVHRPDETTRMVGGGSSLCGSGGNGVLYCPSPYATTRVQLYFPSSAASDLDGGGGSVTTREINDQNCYDMPLLKQASTHSILSAIHHIHFCSIVLNIPCSRLI